MSTEEQILAAAAEILEREGPHGITTRAVCAAAKVTAPTLYHHFGDKAGLINALVNRGINEFMSRKRGAQQTADPLNDLRRGWNEWIEFAVSRPKLFGLMIAQSVKQPELAQEAYSIMHAIVVRLHAQRRLQQGLDANVAALAIQAAANGVVGLLQSGASSQQVRATASLLFDAVLARVISNLGI